MIDEFRSLVAEAYRIGGLGWAPLGSTMDEFNRRSGEYQARLKSLSQQLDAAKADSARLDFLFAQVAFGVTLPDHDGSVGRDYRLGDVEGSPREQMDEWMRIREQYV